MSSHFCSPAPPSCLCSEFEEAAELLSAEPGASTLSVSADTPSSTAAGEDVKLDVSEDEEGQEESSEVKHEWSVVSGLKMLSS